MWAHPRGEAIDARADVFAVGILLWELVAGHRMYRAEPDGGTLLDQARAAVIPELPARPRALPNEPELRRIVSRALSVDRDQRYPSASAMQRDLEEYASGAKLLASPLRFREWLEASFGTEVMTQRRMRQRAAEALEMGPAVTLTPLPFRAATPTPTAPMVAPGPPAPTAPRGEELAAPPPAPAPPASLPPEPEAPAPPAPAPMAAAAGAPLAPPERSAALVAPRANRNVVLPMVAVLALLALALAAFLVGR